MDFEQTMEALGRELGVPLPVRDGHARFGAGSLSNEHASIEIDIAEQNDGETAVVSSDLGELPEEGAEELMMKMLEANHMFGGTGGATFTVEDRHMKLEFYVRFEDLAKGNASELIMPFVALVRHWSGVLSGGSS